MGGQNLREFLISGGYVYSAGESRRVYPSCVVLCCNSFFDSLEKLLKLELFAEPGQRSDGGANLYYMVYGTGNTPINNV